MTIKKFSNVVDAKIINIGYFVRKIKYTVSEHFGDPIKVCLNHFRIIFIESVPVVALHFLQPCSCKLVA